MCNRAFASVYAPKPHHPRNHVTYNQVAFASFGARRYTEGIRWASRAINEMPKMVQPYVNLATCRVGAGEIKSESRVRDGETAGARIYSA